MYVVAVDTADLVDKCGRNNWCEDCITAMSECAWCRDEVTYHINPLVTNGFSHPYHLGESTFIFWDIGRKFSF